MNYRHFCFWLLLIPLAAPAQNKSNILQAKVLGDGLLLSAQYERKVIPAYRLWLNGGLGCYYNDGLVYLTLPFGIKYWQPLSKEQRDFIGVGTAATFSKAEVTLYAIIDYGYNAKPRNGYLNYIPSLSYRHVSVKRMVYTGELAIVVNNFGSFPILGLSIGGLF